MAHTTSFDTLHNYERLLKVGFNKDQAKEQTAILSELVDEKLATKQDLKHELKILYLKMTVTLGSIMLTGLGLIKLLKL